MSNIDVDTLTHNGVSFSVEQDWLYVKVLRVDPTYQRPLDNQRVARMAREFDLDALGTIEVSKRKDGTFWIIDGQHRIAALQAIGFNDDKVPCLIHTGLTVQEEAKIYRLRNTATRPNSFAMFRAALAEREPEAVDIDNVVRRCGLSVAMGGARGNIQACSALRKVYRNTGGLILERTLRTMIAAWGNQSTNFQADLLVGVAIIEKRYGKELDEARLRSVLATVTPTALLAQARTTKVAVSSTSGSLGLTAVPEIIVALYNKGLRKNKLAEWERRTNAREIWK